MFAGVHERGQPGPTVAELIGDLTEHLVGGFGVFLGENLA